jgi:hypothetical protein
MACVARNTTNMQTYTRTHFAGHSFARCLTRHFPTSYEYACIDICHAGFLLCTPDYLTGLHVLAGPRPAPTSVSQQRQQSQTSQPMVQLQGSKQHIKAALP